MDDMYGASLGGKYTPDAGKPMPSMTRLIAASLSCCLLVRAAIGVCFIEEILDIPASYLLSYSLLDENRVMVLENIFKGLRTLPQLDPVRGGK